jgi:glutathione S-transferase
MLRPMRYADDAPSQEAIKAKARAAYGEYLKEIDRLLIGRRWSIGSQYTIVDAYLLVFYRWGNRSGFAVKLLENYTALIQRVMARSAVKKVMADEGITLD